ncbi:HalOD1 output domain-containing protein [Halalkalirubrum salinum]|uniref:HalOD1 output domain-containing protein n=1 Tax=Halalkalirubrum salinum TaxID=2563889 RepID=UPI0022392F10|nr:HalOD1 output domain-containing protein [Halalkalirubrum salinum]
MAKISPHRESEPTGWSTDSQIVCEFDRPVRVSDAVIETLMEAVEDWPELSRSPPVFEFVDPDKLDGLFKTRTVEGTSHMPSVEFLFQDALVTVMYASTVCVIVERDA